MVEFAVQTHVLEQAAHIAVVALLEAAIAVVDHSEAVTVVELVEALLEAALAAVVVEVHSAVALPVALAAVPLEEEELPDSSVVVKRLH